MHHLRLSVLGPLLLLASCGNISEFNTNLDKQNFTEYFAPSQVQIVTVESLGDEAYIDVGVVEGEACQAKPHHAVPNDSEARTDARRKAANLGANAIIFQQCTLVKPQNDTCYQVKLCYGRALKIQTN